MKPAQNAPRPNFGPNVGANVKPNVGPSVRSFKRVFNELMEPKGFNDIILQN